MMKPNEFEALSILMEECGEVTQILSEFMKECGNIVHAIGKIFRHGYDSKWGDSVSNREQLELEVADILGTIEILQQMGVVNTKNIIKRINEKYGSLGINRFLHTFQLQSPKNLFMVRYSIDDGGEYEEYTRPIKHWNDNIDDLRNCLEKYFDHSYLENVTIREIIPIENWIKDNTLDLEKWYSNKVR